MEIDVVRQVGAVVREVRARTHEGVEARVVVATRRYETTIEDLWDAITNPERIPRWFLPVTGELKLGGRYQLQGNAGGAITACSPPRSLSLTWEFAGQVSWVNVALTGEGEATILELEHIAPVNEFWDQYGPGAVGVGWELSLLGLDRHLAAGGAAVDPARFQAWSMSEEGKAFARASAAGWGEAHAALDGNAEAARASAARTAAFYTGETPPGAG